MQVRCCQLIAPLQISSFFDRGWWRQLIGHARPEQYIAAPIVPPTIKQKVSMADGYAGDDGTGAASEMVIDGDGFTHYKTVPAKL